MTKKPSPRAKNMKFDFLQDQVRIQTFALQILIIQQSHVWWMANPCVSELSFSLYRHVIHTMHVIYLIQHWHRHMSKDATSSPGEAERGFPEYATSDRHRQADVNWQISCL